MLNESDIVLVTGGTGFTGKVLVRQLCELGCEVRLIARSSSNRSALAELPIKWYEGNIYDEDTVKRAADGVHYIFHIAAAYREAKIADDVYRLVHEESTKLLATAASNNPGFKRFIHVSTVGVLGHIEHPPADENTPYNPGDVYQRTKTAAEQWILAFHKQTGMPLVVLRPSAIYGPEDDRLLKLFRMARLPLIPVIGFTKGLYHLIHVEDLTRFMLLAAEAPNIDGEVFICGDPEPMPIKAIISTIASHLGKTPKFIRLPASPIFLAAHACEFVCKKLDIEPPIYPRRVAFFTKDRAFDTAKMRTKTNFEYKFSNDTGLKAVCDEYLEKGWL